MYDVTLPKKKWELNKTVFHCPEEEVNFKKSVILFYGRFLIFVSLSVIVSNVCYDERKEKKILKQ